MNKDKFSEVLKYIKCYAGIFARGISRMLYGTLIAGLLVVSFMGFFLVTIDTGYTAVFDFVAACATLWLAGFNLYVLGIKKRGVWK